MVHARIVLHMHPTRQCCQHSKAYSDQHLLSHDPAPQVDTEPLNKPSFSVTTPLPSQSTPHPSPQSPPPLLHLNQVSHLHLSQHPSPFSVESPLPLLSHHPSCTSINHLSLLSNYTPSSFSVITSPPSRSTPLAALVTEDGLGARPMAAAGPGVQGGGPPQL